MNKGRRLLIVAAIAVAAIAGITSWISTEAAAEDGSKAALARIQGKIEQDGVEVTSIAMKNGTVSVALDTSKLDATHPDTSVLLRLYRAAAEEDIAWLEYSLDGRPSSGLAVPKLDSRAHVDPVKAQEEVAAWIEETAEETKVQVKALRYSDYKLALEVVGDLEGLQQFADRVTNGGMTVHENGKLDFLHLSAFMGQKLSYDASFDYELGIRVQWRGPGFDADL